MRVPLQRLFPLGVLVFSVGAVLILLWSPRGVARLRALERQRQELELETERLGRDIERLRIQAKSIKSSPSSIERVARDELGLVRQTEIVVQFDPR